MITDQAPDLLPDLEVVHAHRTLRVFLQHGLGDLDRFHVGNLVLRQRRDATLALELVQQLRDDVVQPVLAPRVVAEVTRRKVEQSTTAG